MGCPDVAQFNLKHVINLSPGEKDPFSNWEERIVYYSDKLVNNYTIVSIDERYDYLIRKYGNNEPERCRRILCTKQAVLEIEKEILSKAGLKPGDIKNLIRSEKSEPIYK
ncbi:MAG: hypothetical protein NTV63_00010 [Candidatus Woesearchaeota archaeon]|nr:hypothetical protein [Candidatus Woesearchaeota archaeon]